MVMKVKYQVTIYKLKKKASAWQIQLLKQVINQRIGKHGEEGFGDWDLNLAVKSVNLADMPIEMSLK